ncbi:MAG: hypothetical protein IJE89_04465 [Bacilli bacterium]|nr:hypothetical protein [Bacilli bacterium]
MNNKFIKKNFNGLTKEVHEWELVKLSTVFKPEYKQGNVEITRSYLNAAKKLYLALKLESHPEPGMTTLKTDQLTMPFLYLCRHTIELAIKAVLDNNKITYGNIHNLNTLFLKLPISTKPNDDHKLLIEVLDLVDDKGMWLRYDKDLKLKKEYIEKPLFINSNEIIKTTEDLTNFLLINIDNH